MPKQTAHEDRVHEMVEQVEEAKRVLASLQGEKRQLLQQLKSLGVDSPEQARKLLKDTEKEIDVLQKKLADTLQRLEKNYKWT